jgi:Alpha/beta hydrolase domain
VLLGGGGQVRTDLDIKVWKFLSETDVPGQASTSRQPDTDRFRWWEVAGTSHLDAQLSRGLGQLGLRAAGGAPVDGPPAGPSPPTTRTSPG